MDQHFADCQFVPNCDQTIYAGLTEKAITLAVQHQLDQNRTHTLTVIDKVKLCRKKFADFKGIDETDRQINFLLCIENSFQGPCLPNY